MNTTSQLLSQMGLTLNRFFSGEPMLFTTSWRGQEALCTRTSWRGGELVAEATPCRALVLPLATHSIQNFIADVRQNSPAVWPARRKRGI